MKNFVISCGAVIGYVMAWLVPFAEPNKPQTTPTPTPTPELKHDQPDDKPMIVDCKAFYETHGHFPALVMRRASDGRVLAIDPCMIAEAMEMQETK